MAMKQGKDVGRLFSYSTSRNKRVEKNAASGYGTENSAPIIKR